VAVKAAATAGDGESLDRRDMREVPPCVLVVSSSHEARRVAALLTAQYRDNVFGADTEVCCRRNGRTKLPASLLAISVTSLPTYLPACLSDSQLNY